MAHKYAIFISKWDKEEVKYFDNLDEAKAEWDNICANKFALKTDGGKNVVISNPRLPEPSYTYFKTFCQKSW